MNKKLKFLTRFLALLLSLIMLVLLPRIFTKANGLEWMENMLIYLNGLFILEAWMSFRGRKTILQYFNFRDKVVFFFAMAEVSLVLTLLKILQIPRSLETLIGFTGILFGLLISQFFGSSGMKEVLSKPRQGQTPS